MAPESSGAAAQGIEPGDFERAMGTERTYFEMAARIEPLPGAQLAWMPGLTASPAATVIHRVQPDVVAALGEEWIHQAEHALANVGARLARIYVDAPDSSADEMLRGAGYAARDEIVFVDSLPDPSSELSLRPVKTADDWQEKLDLHQAMEAPPDGHPSRAADWVELERRKCAAGMEAFLAEVEGQVVGAIGAVRGDGILRLKNLVVRPDRRRRAIGQAMVSTLAQHGRRAGIGRQCVFAVRGEAGELLYRAAGMQVAGVQVEWSKPMPRGHP